jgi:hypothetical protein
MKRFTHPPVVALILAVVLFLLWFLPNGFGSNVDVAVAQATNIVRLVFLGVIAAGRG